MKKNIFFTLALLITCLVFSGQSLAGFGPWSQVIAGGTTYCSHSTGEPRNFSLVKFEVVPGNGTTQRYMTLLSGSSASVVRPQIIYSNNEIKKKNPSQPFVLLSNYRSHIQQGNNRWYMGYNYTKAGELYSCRIKPGWS